MGLCVQRLQQRHADTLDDTLLLYTTLCSDSTLLFFSCCCNHNETLLTCRSINFHIHSFCLKPHLYHTYNAAIMDMDNMLGGAGGGGGAMGQFPLEQWFYEMPACTRYWTTATIITSVLVQCHVITPFQLFYSFRAVFVKNQVRRLIRK